MMMMMRHDDARYWHSMAAASLLRLHAHMMHACYASIHTYDVCIEAMHVLYMCVETI